MKKELVIKRQNDHKKFHQAASKMLIQRPPFSSPFLLIIDLHRSQPLDLFVKVYMLSFAF